VSTKTQSKLPHGIQVFRGTKDGSASQKTSPKQLLKVSSIKKRERMMKQ